MSETAKAIILGIVQGLSEFLPISSSGHLVLFEKILNFNDRGIALEVFVHFGTLISVFIVFRREIWAMIRSLPAVPQYLRKGLIIDQKEDEYKALSFFIVIGSIPAAVIGILFKDQIVQLFANPLLVLFTLLITAVILWSSRHTQENQFFLTWNQAIIIGLAQAFAIIPGISRSGVTIVVALWLGIQRETAASFSFLLSIPVIFGASLLQFSELFNSPPPQHEIFHLGVATVAAAISGYLAIIWLLDIVRKQKLEWFGVYCAAVGIIGLLFYSL